MYIHKSIKIIDIFINGCYIEITLIILIGIWKGISLYIIKTLYLYSINNQYNSCGKFEIPSSYGTKQTLIFYGKI